MSFSSFPYLTSRYPFFAAVDRLESGDWRPVTESGKRTLIHSLLTCSDNPVLDNVDDPEYKTNLVTGIKHDELSIFMPKSWVASSKFYLFFF